MTDGRLRIVVGGFIGLLPAGGVTWDYLQYPLGLALLGHDVYYVEDTRLWPIYQKAGSAWGDSSRNVEHLRGVMDAFGFRDRWAYRDEASGTCFGMTLDSLLDLCRTADVFLNISCSTVLRDEYRRIPARILLDSDPMFTQIQHEMQTMFTPGQSGIRDLLRGHSHHFTFGENVGSMDCKVPPCGYTWHPTRQPICLDHWSVTPLPSDRTAAFTTLMNWTAAPPILYAGQTWGQKDVEFRRFISVPRTVPDVRFAIAVNQTGGAPFPADEARRNAWAVLDPDRCARDWQSYQAFIRGSRGEFSVAKQTYVMANTGWFSCRSACYLASGRPVITQDTGWTRNIPAGMGLLAFHDLPSALDAIHRVTADPEAHARAARGIAEEHFDSRRVLSGMLTSIGA